MKWAIHNHLLPYKLTTPQLFVWLPTSFNSNTTSNEYVFSLDPLLQQSKTLSHILACRCH
eukprot:CCRYP_007337-RA/>CCRYP_007337-RA protein AED:0.44 eAED:1.00 QI:0/-1/0/1/-1/0/1/0/59